MVGMFSDLTTCLVLDLLPMVLSAVLGGPMKAMPFSSHRAAKLGFSDRKP